MVLRMHPSLKPPAIVAILRGVTPNRVETVAHILFDEGIRAIEVPLNSPQPFDSIAKLAQRMGSDCLCGAGTVLERGDVGRVADAGGMLIVTPNTDASVIGEACRRNLIAMPGFATASEAFTAIHAGARHLKLFPATTYGPDHLKALKAVLPTDLPVYAVGGVNAGNVGPWISAGVSGFGFGSDLFRPDYSDDDIKTRARTLIDTVARATRQA
jgi:2-dehydro-3-deoxyphosphogalactonate aldolase